MINLEPKDKWRLEAAASIETIAVIVQAAGENMKHGNKLTARQEVDAQLMFGCADTIRAIALNIRDAIGTP